MGSVPYPERSQPSDPVGFDLEAEFAAFLGPQPAQATLRTLFDYARTVAMDSLPEDEQPTVFDPEPRTISGSRIPRWGPLLELSVDLHEFPTADPVNGLRHVATITSSEAVEGSLVTRTRELWWGEHGDYFEVRGDACTEADAYALIQGMWPDTGVATD